LRSFKAHSLKQSTALFSQKKITIAATGVQWGKTILGVVWLKMLMHQFNDPEDAFIVTSPTYKILSQSTLPPFLRMNEDIGKYHGQESSFQIRGGGKVWFRTNHDPDSVVGITNVRGILCDEAGKYSRYFWDNIQARSSICKAPVMIVTSPYSLNWLYKDFIKKWMAGDEHVHQIANIVMARSDENPYFPKEEYEERKLTMDPRRHNMIYGGKFEKAEGLVYSHFDEKIHVVEPFSLPHGTRYFAGVDWGYTDPFVIKVRAITPDGTHYSIAEFYKTQLRSGKMVEAAARFASMWPIETFFCDPSRPDYISEFCAHGLTAVGATNAIQMGIDRHHELIISDRYYVFAGTCRYTLDEYEMYHYPEEKELNPNQDGKDELPVDQANHCMDCERYVTYGTWDVVKRRKRDIITGIKTNDAFFPAAPDDRKLLKEKKYWEKDGYFE